MSDEIEVTACGEIVAHGVGGDLWIEPRNSGGFWAHVGGNGHPSEMGSVILTGEQLAAWCLRVLWRVGGEQPAAGAELMRVLGRMVGDPGRSAVDDAWMRRSLELLRQRPETDPGWDPVPMDAGCGEDEPAVTIEQVMEAWGIRDLQLRVVSRVEEPMRVVVNSEEVDWRAQELFGAGCCVPTIPTRFGSVLGVGGNHAEALRCALDNAAGPWGDGL